MPKDQEGVDTWSAPSFGSRMSMMEQSTGMLEDIYETPDVLSKVLKECLKGSGENSEVTLPSLNKPLPATHKFAGKTVLEVMAACRAADGSFQNKITIIGCGTSYHVAVYGEYIIEGVARIPVEVTYASEYRYKTPLHRPGDVLIAVSSSGETLDTIESLKNLKKSPNGDSVLTLAVVNEAGSTLESLCDASLYSFAGKEVGIASTKVFSAASLAFVMLALAIGEKTETLNKAEKSKLVGNLLELPNLVQMVLDKEAKPLRPPNNFIFLGRGFNFPIALEGAMKCKEIAYIHAEGYPAAEMKHGPIALIDQFMPVVCIAPRSDPTYEKIKANIEEVKTRNGAMIVITEDYNSELEEICEHVIKVPSTHEYFMPLVSVIPLQLLAYMMGILRGNEVDNPRGLEKSISKEKVAS